MKKNLLVLIIAIVSLPMIGQISPGANNAAYNLASRVIDLQEEDAAFGLTQSQFDATIGMPYSNDEFIKGTIYKDDKIAQAEVWMRYNIFSDEIEIKNSSDEENYSALIKDPSIFVKIFQDIYVYVPFEGSIQNGQYFKVVAEGTNFDLYKKEKVEYKPPYYAKTSYERDQSAEWINSGTYFLVSKSGDFYELPNSRSKVLKVMNNKEKEVKTFIKKNNIDLDEEKDLEKLVNYYNSII